MSIDINKTLRNHCCSTIPVSLFCFCLCLFDFLFFASLFGSYVFARMDGSSSSFFIPLPFLRFANYKESLSFIYEEYNKFN